MTTTRTCAKCGGTERLMFTSYRCDNDACADFPTARVVGEYSLSQDAPMVPLLPPGAPPVPPDPLEPKPTEHATRMRMLELVLNEQRLGCEQWTLCRSADSPTLRLALYAFELCSYCLLDECDVAALTPRELVALVGREMDLLRDNLSDAMTARASIRRRIERRNAQAQAMSGAAGALTPEWKAAIDARGQERDWKSARHERRFSPVRG